MRPRLFVGFFGLTRALSLTIDSIEGNIFGPLDRAGLVTVRAAHFNKPDFIDAPRSGEHHVPFSVGDLSRLRLDQVEVEPQRDETIAAPLACVLHVPYQGEADPQGFTRRNSLHQLHSLSRLGRIFESMGPASFDAALLLRPDLRYLDPIPIRQLLAQIRLRHRSTTGPMAAGLRALRRRGHPEADIVTPWWQHCGGLNDRFAFATPEAAMVYMTRIANVAAFCAARSWYQPESLLLHSIQRAGLRHAGTWVRAQRVRSDGRIAALDQPGLKKRIYYLAARPVHRALAL